MPKPRRPARAKRIRAASQRSVEAILEVGRLLEQAKAALPHGQFERMVEKDLPFGPRAARQRALPRPQPAQLGKASPHAPQ